MNIKGILFISFILLVFSLAAVSASDLGHVAISDSNSDGSILAHVPVTVSSHDDSVVFDDNLDDVAVDDSSIDDGPSVPDDGSSIDDDKSIPDDGGSSSSDDKKDSSADVDGDINDGDSIIINITNDTSKNKYNDKPISNVKEASGSFEDLQSIIDLTPSGTTLCLSRDYKGSKDQEIKVNKNLIIDGQGHTIDGNKACRIFHSTSGNVVLKNLKLINGYVDGSIPSDYNYFGGAILMEDNAKCTIENCHFEDNWADDYGGAIANLGKGMLTIKNCTFKDNTADDMNGGAIYSKGAVLIVDSKFKGNKAYSGGGAVSLYGSGNDNKIINCYFESNHAELGGAFYCSSTNLTVENSTFRSNSASQSGGAIHTGRLLKVINCLFESNRAEGSSSHSPRGGAICGSGGDVYIDNSTFSNNYADYKGGAIYMTYIQNNLYINKNQPYNMGYTTLFNNNAANDYSGGAIFSNSVAYITNAKFTSNKACTTGGAVELSEDSVFDHCLFNSNSCEGGISQNRGGAIHGDRNINIYDSIFNNNYAKTDGGAVYSDKTVLAQRCSFDSNRASGAKVKCYGGAIRAAYANLIRCNFTKNYSENHGGAVFTDTTPSEIKNCKFIDNKADEDGGAVYINNENTVTFSQCSFINNCAGDEGGAIYLDSTSAHIKIINNFFDKNAASNGKAVYNYGFYDTISSNWWGSQNPTTGNHMLVEWHLFSDDYHTDSNPLKMDIYATEHVVKVGQESKIVVHFLNSNGNDFSGVLPMEDIKLTLPIGIKEISTNYYDCSVILRYVGEVAGIYDFRASLFDQSVAERINVVDALSSTISGDKINNSQMTNAHPVNKAMTSVTSGFKSVDNPQFAGDFNIMAAFLSLLSIAGL